MGQIFQNELSVGPLAPGASVVVPHLLENDNGGIVPHHVMPSVVTAIAVTAVDDTNVTFRNDGSQDESADFMVQFDHSVQSAVAGGATISNFWTGVGSGLSENHFGDGSDGDVVLGAPATLARDMYYNSFDTDGNDVDCAGFRIFCKEEMLVAAGSMVHRNGNAGVAEAAGAALAAAMLGGSGAGGAGGVNAGAGGGAIAQCIGGEAGVGGTGNGGASAGGAVGAATGLTTAEPTPQSIAFIQYPCDCQAGNLYNGGTGGGGGGGDGAADEGGGGGGGGGVVCVLANQLFIENGASITAVGGEGADGTAANCGGGGGGGGGGICLMYRTLSNGGVISAAGGLGGTGVANGTDGAAGDAGDVYQYEL